MWHGRRAGGRESSVKEAGLLKKNEEENLEISGGENNDVISM